MNHARGDARASDSDAPFGTTPRRAWTAVFVLGAVYLVWFGVLLWLASTQVGWK